MSAAVAVMMASRGLVTRELLNINVPLNAPAAILTVGVTTKAVSFEDNVTSMPEAGASAVSTMVPRPLNPPTND